MFVFLCVPSVNKASLRLTKAGGRKDKEMRETRQDKTLGQVVRKWINTNPGLKVDNRFNILNEIK